MLRKNQTGRRRSLKHGGEKRREQKIMQSTDSSSRARGTFSDVLKETASDMNELLPMWPWTHRSLGVVFFSRIIVVVLFLRSFCLQRKSKVYRFAWRFLTLEIEGRTESILFCNKRLRNHQLMLQNILEMWTCAPIASFEMFYSITSFVKLNSKNIIRFVKPERAHNVLKSFRMSSTKREADVTWSKHVHVASEYVKSENTFNEQQRREEKFCTRNQNYHLTKLHNRLAHSSFYS